MRCLQCRKQIGVIRRLVDRQFCCRDHRNKARHAYSARLARDLNNEEQSYEEEWLSPLQPKKRQSSFSAGSGLLLVVVATVLVLFLPSQPDRPTAPPSYMPKVPDLGDRFAQALPGKASLSLREDFRSDLRDWQSALGSLKDGWTKRGNDSVEIGRLRLWKPSLAMADYNVHFQGQIEEKALGWAIRASDTKNYYATKIQIIRPDQWEGPQSAMRAEIVRYSVVDGKPVNKVRLPIPLTWDAKSVYNFHVRVKGDRFTTLVNDRVMDSWTDRRFRRGGVGFFADPGEQASLNWVTISDRETFFDRFLSFSFLIAPVDLQPGRW